MDPVVAEDGKSYERAAMLLWLSQNGAVSPPTNVAMSHADLLPNHTLRSIINSRKTAR